MNTKHVYRIVIFVILTSILGFLKSAASQEELDSHLNSYLEFAENQKNSRVFRENDGYPRIDRYLFTDQDSMIWYRSYRPTKYYIFTGTDFTDVLATNILAEKDSIVTAIQTDDKTPFLQGRKAVYKWLGYKLQAYKIPSNDRIVKTYDAGQNDVYVYGERGYGILRRDDWRYYNYDKFTLRSEAKTIDRFFSKLSKTLITLYDALGESNLVNVELIDHTMKTETTLPYETEGVVLYPELFYQHNNGNNVIFTFKKSKIVYYYDSQTKRALSYKLPNDVACVQLIAKNKQAIIVTESITTKPWFIRFYSLNEEENRLVAIKELHTEYSSDFMNSAIGMMAEGKLLDFESLTSQIYRNIDTSSGLLTILDIDQNKAITIDLKHKLDNIRFNAPEKSNTIEFVYKHPKMPKVYRYGKLTINPDCSYTTSAVIDLVDFSRSSLTNSLIANDKIYYSYNEGLYVVPIKKSTTKLKEVKSTDQSYSFLTSSKSDRSFMDDYSLYTVRDKVILVERVTDNSNGILKFYFYEDNNFKLIKKVESNNTKIFSYLVIPKEGKVMFAGKERWESYDFGNNKLQKTMLTKGSSQFLSKSYWVEAKGKFKTLPQAFNTDFYKFDELALLKKYNSKLSEFFDNNNWYLRLYPAAIDEKGTMYVESNGNLKLLGHGRAAYNDVGKDVVESVTILPFGDNAISVSFPTYSYDPASGEIKLLPNWLNILEGEKDLYVVYKEKPGPKGKITIRKVIDGVAVKSPYDPIISYEDYKQSWINPKKMNNDLMQVFGNKVYYLDNGQWMVLKVPDFVDEYNVHSGITIGETVYLGLDSKVLKFLPDGSTYLYNQNDGIPSGSIKLHEYGGQIFINTGDKIFRFAEPVQNTRIVLSGYSAKDKLISAKLQHIFEYRTNSFRFPVYILNTLYPEKCILEYQLKGFNDAPVRIPFTKEIRFDNLKPGSYSFSYTATTETGQKVHSPIVKFTIRPPYYATWLAYLIYVLFGGAAIYGIFKLRTRQLKRQNLALEKTVEQRTAELKERQQRIQESIEYASLIQKSILPQREELIQRFRQHYVIWKPRDIVGGDFYWLYENEAGEIFFSVIDCTGHGVPGALLSMTVNSLLDKLVKDGGISSPAEILTRLHREIGAALRQTEAKTQQDGLEIALVKIDARKQSLVFSGAGLHLLHYDPESKATNHLRGNKHGLGGLKWHAELVFEELQVPYAEKQRIYLYTDGILDQPVAEAGKPKRLGSVAWLEFLVSIAGLPMEEQETSCNELIGRMLACHEQRDDITVVGIEL